MKQYASGRSATSCWAAGVLLLLAAGPCQADLLSFGFDPAGPAVQSSNGTLTYNAAMHRFHSDMIPLAFNAAFLSGGTTPFLGNGTLTIDLTVDASGGFVASGQPGVRLTGALNLNGMFVSGELLTGQIIAFGAQLPGPPTRDFNGLFEIEGGLLTETVHVFSVGELAGFILYAENVTGGTLGDFTQNFASTNVKSDLGALVPEPGTLASVLVGSAVLAGLGLFKRRAANRLLLGTFARE